MSLSRFEQLVARKKALQVAEEQLPGALGGDNGQTEELPEQDFLSRLNANISRRIDSPSGPPGMKEANRVAKLPVRLEFPEDECLDFERRHVQAHALEAGVRLFPTQVNAGLEFEHMGGGFFPIGVGWGKTWVGFMCAAIAFHDKEIQRIVLHIPAGVAKQTVKHGIPFVRKNGVLRGLPIHNMHRRNSRDRIAMAKAAQRGLYIMPYSLLSQPDGLEVLETLMPGLVIADEAHYLANRGATCTKRMDYYTKKYKPRMVSMSGTITSKSLMNHYHLQRWSLGDNAPVPTTQVAARDWAQVIDAQAEPSHGMMAKMRPLLDWARLHFPDLNELEDTQAGFRRAFRRRMEASPGIVMTGDEDVGVSLIVRNDPSEVADDYPGKKELQYFVDQINNEWKTPSGDEIDHAIHTWKWLFELSAGFYNNLVWPEIEVLQRRHQWTETEAERHLLAAQEHLAAESAYHKQLRLFLEATNIPGLQQPMQIGGVIARGHKDPLFKNIWRPVVDAWIDKKRKESPEGCPWDYKRDSVVERVCDYKMQQAVRWAAKHPHGILWYYHQGVGDWLFEMMQKAGADVVYAPAGKDDAIDESKGKFVVASITSHGTGKNLQFHQHQRVVQMPRPVKTVQQALGRTHRNGQEADELVISTDLTTEFDILNFAALLNDTVYVQQTTGERMKLLAASYDPPPSIVPMAVLEERGFKPKSLSKEQRRYLQDLFLEKAS